MLSLRDRLWLSGLAPAAELDGFADRSMDADTWLAGQRRPPRRLKGGGGSALRRELAEVDEAWALVREVAEDARIEWIRLPEQGGGLEASEGRSVGSRLWAIQCAGPLPETGALPWLRASRRVSMGDDQELGVLFRGWANALPSPFLVGDCGGAAHRVGEVLRRAGHPVVRVALRSLPDLCREGHGDWLRAVVAAGGSVLSVAPLCRRTHPRQHLWRSGVLAALAGPWVVLSARRGGGVWNETRAALRRRWPVLALPVRPRIGSGEGVPELLAEGAAPLHAPAALWEALGQRGPCASEATRRGTGVQALSAEARSLLRVLRHTEVLEVAGAEAGLPAAQARALVLELELEGLVETFPGDRVLLR